MTERGFRVAAVSFEYTSGMRMAAGCICESSAEEEILKRLSLLENYVPKTRDLVGIDFEAANALCGAFASQADKPDTYGMADMHVIAAGCSLYVPDADIPEDMTTGGILGDPFEEPESSEDEVERLKEGFSLMTLSGSPGLAADADRGTVNTVLYLIKKLKSEGRINDEKLLNDLFESFGIHTALLVFDATGTDAELFLAAKDDRGVRIFS